MAEDTKIELKLSEKSRQMLRKMPDLIVPALFKGMQQFMKLVEGRIRGYYLSGGALNRRSGRLRNDTHTDAKIDGDKVIGRAYTSVIYGKTWELGFKGPVRVMAHARRIRQAFGKPIAPKSILVKAHTRNMDMPKKPFMRPAINDHMKDGLNIISNRIEEAFETCR